MASPTDAEKKCIRILADAFQNNGEFLSQPRERFQAAGLQLSQTDYLALMRTMEAYRVIREPLSAEGDIVGCFICPESLRLAREIDEEEKEAQEPKDIVEQVKTSARKHPIVGRLVVGFVLLLAIMQFVHLAMELLKDFNLVRP